MMIYRPLVLTENQDKYDVRVKAVGGGIVAQSAAIRHGISRALLKVNEEYKNVLRSEGLLTRDARVKERKKYGRKELVRDSNSQRDNFSRYVFKRRLFENRLFY